MDQSGLTANSTAWGAVGLGSHATAPSALESFAGKIAGFPTLSADVTGSDLTALEAYLTALA